MCPLQIAIIQGVLSDINMKKGESECQYYMDKLEYLEDRQRDPRIEQSKALLCHGELRNKSGAVSPQTSRLTPLSSAPLAPSARGSCALAPPSSSADTRALLHKRKRTNHVAFKGMTYLEGEISTSDHEPRN